MEDLIILEDQMDAITLIKKDHRDVERLFEKYKSSDDNGEKFLIAQTICSELSIHTFIEEEFLYPTYLQLIRSSPSDIEHSVHDHIEAKEIIIKILTFSDGESPEFSRLVSDLEKSIEHHVKEEEEKILPSLANIVSSDLLLNLGKKIKESKPKAPTRPVLETDRQAFDRVKENSASIKQDSY